MTFTIKIRRQDKSWFIASDEQGNDLVKLSPEKADKEIARIQAQGF